MTSKSRKLKAQSDSQSLNLQEFLRQCSNSRYEELGLRQKLPAKVISPQQYKNQPRTPKKRRYHRASIAERVEFPQVYKLQPNIDNIEQKTYNYMNMTSPLETPVNQAISTTRKLQSMATRQPTIQLQEQTTVLRDIIKKYKIKSIVRNFVKKIKRVSVLKDPIEYKQFDNSSVGFIYSQQGLQIPQTLQNAFSLLTIIQIVIFSMFFSLSFVYSELRNTSELIYLEFFIFFSLIFQILTNLFTVKYSSGKKMKVLVEIWNFYAEGYLLIDFLGACALLLNIITQWQLTQYLKFILMLKIPQCVNKMQKIEVNLIKNLYNQQYWSVVKILLFNFTFAHLISLLLTGMCNLSPDNNWMTVKGIQDSPWYQKYSWSYYWANTIMLTVGFGDITASNYKEAICLVFIETFSCMAFAYNINCIGGIIQQIIAKDAQRSQKSKIFTKLNNQNKLSQQISWKISNYIEQTAQLRKNFNYQQEKKFITNLPAEMKREYLKESNKYIFENIQFFRSFINKTLYNLAENIEMRVSHPEEIVQHIDDDYNLIILKNGSLGLVYKRANFQLKQSIMDRIIVKQKQNPSLVNLDFIVRKRPFYEIKSMQYAIFYYLPYDKFIQILRLTEMDYQFFCTLRDRIKNIPDQFEVLDCQLCGGKHLKALCPKLHYIPFQETIIHRHLHQERVSKNQRSVLQKIVRIKLYSNAFYVYKKSIQNLQKLGNIVSRRRSRDVDDSYQQTTQFVGSKKFQENMVEKSLHLIHTRLREFTNQAIKEEINKLIKSDNCEDEIWMLKSDTLCDFNAYFPEHNPSSISYRYVELAELFRSQNLLKVHTSVVMQQIQYNQFGPFGRHKITPKKRMLRSSIKNKEL